MFLNYIQKVKILVTIIILTISLQIRGQVNLPSVCIGSTQKYWVKGFNGHSNFVWKITDNNGVNLSPSLYTIIDRGDTIQMNWDNTLEGGIYTFTVTEYSENGCIGEPYSQNIVLNSSTINIPFEGVPTNIAVCYGETAKIDPGVFTNYLWQDGSRNKIFYTSESGTYQVRLVDKNYSCSYNEIETTINPLPLVWLGNDTILFENKGLVLDAYNSNIVIYNWSTNENLPSITINAQNVTQKIWVNVEDFNGCKNSDTISITLNDYNNLRIPSAFTPNGDGINDKWYFPAPKEETNVELYPYFDNIEINVFNRWGRLVWNSKNKFIAWDGKDLNGNILPMDSYHYIIRFNIKDKTYLYKGSITIIR